MADLAAPALTSLPVANVDPSADYALVYDASATDLFKMTVADLLYRHQAWVALTDAPTIVSDANLAHNIRFKVTLTANRTLATPTNPIDGGVATFMIKQSTGGHTITLASGFVVPTDITVTLSTAAGVTDFLTAVYVAGSTKWVILALTKGAAGL
jgi:hypothetical protein